MSNTIRQSKIAVPVGTPQVVPVNTFPVGVSVIPGASGSMLVEYTLSARDGTTETWYAWPKGTVSAAATDSMLSPITALRFTATTAAGVAEVCQ